MRTYKRKRPEYTYIEGVHELCRLCLERTTESVPIFNNETNNICASLSVRIMMCVGFEVNREDCLPNSICSTCHKQLSSFYEFRKKCGIMYQKLKCHLLAVKQMESEKALKKIQENNVTKMQETEIIKDTEDNQGATSTNENHIQGDAVSLINGNITENGEEIPDFSGYLSSILLEMGISTGRDGRVASEETLRKIDINSGGGRITFRVMEMEEENRSSGNVFDGAIDVFANTNHEQNSEKGRARPVDPRGPPRCPQCGKSYATRGALRRHARLHTGERPHACRVCRRTFAQREVMRRHELVHRQERPFKCQRCPKSFTQRGGLAAHARSCCSPPALALHRCTACPKVFLHASGLSRHALVHAGRVFSCSPCARRYSDRSSLLRHLRSHKHARTHAHEHEHPDEHERARADPGGDERRAPTDP